MSNRIPTFHCEDSYVTLEDVTVMQGIDDLGISKVTAYMPCPKSSKHFHFVRLD